MSISNRTTDHPAPKAPKGLHDAIIYFADKERVLAFAVAYRWPEGVTCPYCTCPVVSFVSTRSIWKCLNKACHKQFSVKVGTIFEDSPISLSKWFTAMWMLTNCKNGVSSYEIHRAIGVTQKTAWFMLHRIRAAMKARSFDKKLAGIVEADECHIGGLMGNMHKDRRERIKGGRKANSSTGKTIVQAVLERSGEVRTQVLNDLTLAPRLDFLQANVEEDAKLMTDEGYDSPRVDSAFEHEFVNHKLEYVRGNVHCNGVENFWSLLQRGLNGTYIAVEPEHLGAYVDEQAFRYNNRKDNDAGRFEKTLTQTTGRRLTYKDLIRAN
jgi:transposase-like protein